MHGDFHLLFMHPCDFEALVSEAYGSHDDGSWPIWLPDWAAFKDWYRSENRLRGYNGDDPLPEIPAEVGRMYGRLGL